MRRDAARNPPLTGYPQDIPILIPHNVSIGGLERYLLPLVVKKGKNLWLNPQILPFHEMNRRIRSAFPATSCSFDSERFSSKQPDVFENERRSSKIRLLQPKNESKLPNVTPSLKARNSYAASAKT
jgi:hypothetical protein